MLQLQCCTVKWAELQVGGGGRLEGGRTRRIIRGWERTYGFRRISTAALISQPPKYLTCPQHQILRERKLDGKGGEAKRTPLESGKSFKISRLTCSQEGWWWVWGALDFILADVLTDVRIASWRLMIMDGPG